MPTTSTNSRFAKKTTLKMTNSMSLLSFDKVLKIISTILRILSYAIGLLGGNEDAKLADDSE